MDHLRREREQKIDWTAQQLGAEEKSVKERTSELGKLQQATLQLDQKVKAAQKQLNPLWSTFSSHHEFETQPGGNDGVDGIDGLDGFAALLDRMNTPAHRIPRPQRIDMV